MIFLTIINAFRNWRKRGQVRYELYSMSDRQLADIGLTREDIDSVANGDFQRHAYHH